MERFRNTVITTLHFYTEFVENFCVLCRVLCPSVRFHGQKRCSLLRLFRLKKTKVRKKNRRKNEDKKRRSISKCEERKKEREKVRNGEIGESKEKIDGKSYVNEINLYHWKKVKCGTELL